MGTGVLKPGREAFSQFLPYGLMPVLWHRTRTSDLGRDLWEAKHSLGGVQCQSSLHRPISVKGIFIYNVCILLLSTPCTLQYNIAYWDAIHRCV